ncbi:hypothetical protein JQ628_08585 [Bradyrhizobium lablabi]|nr:hypothetical protein [Bradyrhizobium lablabi]
MSSVSEQDHLDPKDPLSYAPRWLREKREAAPTLSPEPIDTQLEKAVSNALRHPLDPQVIEEPEELTRELRRMAILGVAGRFAAAVGVSALVALFFVVMIPASRSPEGINLSASAVIDQIKTALASQPAPENAGAPPASSELQTLLATTPPSSEPVTREQSEQLLNQFVQWQHKPAPNQASQP